MKNSDDFGLRNPPSLGEYFGKEKGTISTVARARSCVLHLLRLATFFACFGAPCCVSNCRVLRVSRVSWFVL